MPAGRRSAETPSECRACWATGWPKELAHRRLRELGEIGGDLLLAVAPRKVRVRLAEAELGQPVHDLGPREGLGEKDDFRMVALDLGNRPLPEGKGLGVRIVDAEDGDARADPVDEDALQLFPQAAPVFALEIEGINVLIFLRRILGILNRAVGPLLEPRLVRLSHKDGRAQPGRRCRARRRDRSPWPWRRSA